VARRVVIDAARASQTRPTEVGPADLESVPAVRDEGERVLSRQVIRQAMAGLTPEHREDLRGLLSGAAPARTRPPCWASPEGTAKSRTFLALRAFRAAMRL
jgi:RNA polymerase sigma-70 factor (ECF subfamily)